MSYRQIKLNNESPDPNNNFAVASTSLAFSWLPTTTASVNFGAPSSGYAAGYNLFFATHSQYVRLHKATGVITTYSSYSPIAPQYQYAYFDVIRLPQGEYEVILRYAGSSASQTLNGTLGMVNNVTSTVLAAKIHTADKYRNNTIQQAITVPSGGMDLSFRILSGYVNMATIKGHPVQSLVIYKRS